VGDLEHATFSNIEHQSLSFVKFTLMPWVRRLEQSFEMALLPPSEQSRIYVKFSVEGLLRGDYKSRMEGYAIGRQNGWLSANDIRELEDMNRIPTEIGGDKYLVNGSMTPLDSAGAAYSKNIDTEQENADETKI
jgi:HK97 family phage portal protein